MNSEEQKLIALGVQWDQAMVTNDVEQIGAFMSMDWVIIGSNGITRRRHFLEAIKNGALSHHTMFAEEAVASIHGETAVLINKGISAGKFNGKEFEMHEWSTNVFVKQNDSWLCVATMVTAVS